MVRRRSSLRSGFGIAMVLLLGLPIADGTAQAQSAGSGHARPHSLGVAKPPVDLTQPADSTDFTQELSHDLNGVYDQYLASKTTIQNAELVYSPSVTWQAM